MVPNLADIQLLNRYNKRLCFLLCVIHVYSKYAWVIPFSKLLPLKPESLDQYNTKSWDA